MAPSRSPSDVRLELQLQLQPQPAAKHNKRDAELKMQYAVSWSDFRIGLSAVSVSLSQK